MTNQVLKRRLKELNAEESLLRQDIKDLSKINKEENFDYIKVRRERKIIENLLKTRKDNFQTFIDFGFSFSNSLILLLNPQKSIEILMAAIINTLFLTIFIHSIRSLICTCRVETIIAWIICSEKTLPEWKKYRKQMKWHLMMHGIIFIAWLFAFISIMPLSIATFACLISSIFSIFFTFIFDYRKTKFNTNAVFLDIAKQVIALDYPNLYQKLD